MRDRKGPDIHQLTAKVLDQVQQLFDTYVVFPSDQHRDAAVLWAAHTHVFEAFDTTPRLSMRSLEPGSGKTLVLDIVEGIGRNTMNLVNVSPGVMWRLMEHRKPTLVLDEVDTMFGRNGSSSAHSHLRGIVNAGHRKGATVPRCVGSTDVKQFSVFGPVALGGLGRLPETIATRSVEIVMRKRKPGDRKVRPFRHSRVADSLDAVRELLSAWSEPAIPHLVSAMPDLPWQDRRADVWEPLVSIAELAGPEWGERSRKAADVLTKEAEGRQGPDVSGKRLLADLRTVIGERDNMFTSEVIAGLITLADTVWTVDNIDARRLARMLAQFGIAPATVRRGSKTSKGYRADSFVEAWELYLTPEEV